MFKKKYIWQCLFFVFILASFDQLMAEVQLDEIQQKNDHESDFLRVKKIQLSEYMAQYIDELNLELNTKFYQKDQKKSVKNYCDSIVQDFKEGDLLVLEPDYVTEEYKIKADVKALRNINIEDIYARRGDEKFRYAKPQGPFEFYRIRFQEQDLTFFHIWFSRKYDQKRSYDSRGLYRIFNHLGEQVTEQKVAYSSSGDKHSLTSYEGFNVLVTKNKDLFMINMRIYFDQKTPNDFLSIKKFDVGKVEFLDTCTYYGKNIRQLFRSK